MGSEGESIPCVNLMRPVGNSKLTVQDFQKSHWWVVASLDEFTIAWNQEVQVIPKFTYTIFYLITGLLLPIWKKLDPTQMRVYRLQTDDGEQLLGRVVESGAMTKFASQFGIACQITDWEVFQAVYQEKQTIKLTKKLSLVNSLVAGQHRLEIVGFQGQHEFNWLKSLGAFSEIIQWKARAFIPTKAEVAVGIIKRIRATQ